MTITRKGGALVDDSAAALQAQAVFFASTTDLTSLAGAPTTVADGSDVNAGTTTDAAVTTDATGTLSSKLRGIVTQLGAVTANPVANTVNDRLKQLLTGIVLAAGSAIIGKVGIDQTTPGTTDSITAKSKGYAAAVSVTRTADTNAYAANDVLGPATGSTAGITFASMGPSAGGEIIITSAAFERDTTALISGETSYNLYLYNVTPPSALGDNAAFDIPSGDRASFLGKISLGTPVDEGSTLYVETNIINKQITLTSGSLFGYLVTVGGYTPTSAAVHKITLHSVGA